MSQFQRHELESHSVGEPNGISEPVSLASFALNDFRNLKLAENSLRAPIPDGKVSERGELLFCSTPVKDSGDQRTDKKIEEAFGKDVMEHLNDWDWLIENKKKLEDGFKKAGKDDIWDLAWRMRELSKVDGQPLIYLSKQESGSAGNLIPKRYDIYLRRGRFRSDDKVGQLDH
ncbi:MAG TPA: hypothetical protein V6C76_06970 [Drouetiella sp.]